MRLLIDNTHQPFIPIREFRARHGLPSSFGVAHFEPKDYSGLGRMDGAGAELNALRDRLLRALAPADPPTFERWLAAVRGWREQFRHELTRINPAVGLHQVEIDFAVAGFGNVAEAVVWAVVRARRLDEPPPTFDRIYADWLNSTVRVGHIHYPYDHVGQHWQVQIIRTAYGRAGLIVRAPDDVYYLHDPSLGCPAEGFMAALLADVAAPVLNSTGVNR